MDTKWLEDFLCLARSGNFSRAAEARHITQSAFSRRIRSLELWLGVPLVDRSTYPARLTEAGAAFREVAEEVSAALAGVREDLRGRDRAARDTVTIAALHSLAVGFFPGWLSRVEARTGPLATRLVCDNTHNCVQSLMAGSCDFLVCFAHPEVPVAIDPERYPGRTLGRERLIPVVAPGWPGAPPLPGRAGERVPVLEYGAETFLGRTIEALLRRRPPSCRLERRFENAMAEGLKAMAIAGHGMAWLPEGSVRHELADGRLVAAGDESWTVPLEIRLHRSPEAQGPAADALWVAHSKSA